MFIFLINCAAFVPFSYLEFYSSVNLNFLDKLLIEIDNDKIEEGFL